MRRVVDSAKEQLGWARKTGLARKKQERAPDGDLGAAGAGAGAEAEEGTRTIWTRRRMSAATSSWMRPTRPQRPNPARAMTRSRRRVSRSRVPEAVTKTSQRCKNQQWHSFATRAEIFALPQ